MTALTAVSPPGLVLELFAGPGGASEGARMIGLHRLVGVEIDPAACATRAAAGHRTVRASVTALDTAPLSGRVAGLLASPPCTTFSAAGKRAAIGVTDVLDALIRDLFEGGRTRAAHRREMARLLTRSSVAGPEAHQGEAVGCHPEGRQVGISCRRARAFHSRLPP